MKQGKDLLNLILNQNKTWIEVDGYKFLYKKLGGKQLLDISISSSDKSESEEMKRINLIISSIVDWKNVKVRDLIIDSEGLTDEELDQEVEFSQELFDMFSADNLNITMKIFEEVRKILEKSFKNEENIKKK